MFRSMYKLVLGGSVLALAGTTMGQVNSDAKPQPRSPKPEYRVVKPRAESHERYGLGVAVAATTPALDSQLRLPPGTGAVVEQVMPDSPADKAGLRQYDLLIEIDGQPIQNPRELANAITSRATGDKVELTFIREGRRQTVTLRIDHRAWDMPQPRSKDSARPKGRGFYFGEEGKNPLSLHVEKDADGNEIVVVRTPNGKTYKEKVLPDLDKLRDQIKRDLEQLDRLKTDLKAHESHPRNESEDDSKEPTRE